MNTVKAYPNTNDPLWPEYRDENGTVIDPWADSPRRYGWNTSDIIPSSDMSFRDFLYDTSSFDDTNYGWPAALEFDEYPTQIQCAPCFVYVHPKPHVLAMADSSSDKFIYGLSSIWGDVYE